MIKKINIFLGLFYADSIFRFIMGKKSYTVWYSQNGRILNTIGEIKNSKKVGVSYAKWFVRGVAISNDF